MFLLSLLALSHSISFSLTFYRSFTLFSHLLHPWLSLSLLFSSFIFYFKSLLISISISSSLFSNPNNIFVLSHQHACSIFFFLISSVSLFHPSGSSFLLQYHPLPLPLSHTSFPHPQSSFFTLPPPHIPQTLIPYHPISSSLVYIPFLLPSSQI